MKPIECTLGPVSQHVNGTTYQFQRDRFGRYVADVQNLLDRSLFLSVAHYREVEAEIEEPKARRARSTPASPVASEEPATDAASQDDGAADAASEQPDEPATDATTTEAAPPRRSSRRSKAKPEA